MRDTNVAETDSMYGVTMENATAFLKVQKGGGRVSQEKLTARRRQGLLAAKLCEQLLSSTSHLSAAKVDRLKKVRDKVLGRLIENDNRAQTIVRNVHYGSKEPSITMTSLVKNHNKRVSAGKALPVPTPPAASSTADRDDPAAQKILAKVTASIVSRPCGLRGFSDYVGGEAIATEFRITVIERLKRDAFAKEHPNVEGILLVGPPGTGKTLLAEAVASELASVGCTFFSASAGSILDKYVGQSEKTLRAYFDLARERTEGGKKASVIFLDELDGFITEGGSAGLLSEINQQMQGLGNASNKGLIIIAATNYPEKMPESVVSRFTKKVFVGLPTTSEIRQIILKSIVKMGTTRVNMNIDVERKQFYSPPDAGNKAERKKAKKAGLFDDLDKISEYLFVNNYAPREIDAMISQAKSYCEEKTVQFTGEALTQEVNQYQMWLWDERPVTRLQELPGGKCGTVIEPRTYFVPVSYCRLDGSPIDHDLSGYQDVETKLTIGVTTYYSHKRKVLTRPTLLTLAGVSLVITKKTQVGNKWQFWREKIYKLPEKPAGLNPAAADAWGTGDLDPARWTVWGQREAIPDMLALAGLAQMTTDDFNRAIGAVKPNRISNAQLLFDYATKYCTSFKKDQSDIRQIGEMAVDYAHDKENSSAVYDQSDDIIVQFMEHYISGSASGAPLHPAGNPDVKNTLTPAIPPPTVKPTTSTPAASTPPAAPEKSSVVGTILNGGALLPFGLPPAPEQPIFHTLSSKNQAITPMSNASENDSKLNNGGKKEWDLQNPLSCTIQPSATISNLSNPIKMYENYYYRNGLGERVPQTIPPAKVTNLTGQMVSGANFTKFPFDTSPSTLLTNQPNHPTPTPFINPFAASSVKVTQPDVYPLHGWLTRTAYDEQRLGKQKALSPENQWQWEAQGDIDAWAGYSYRFGSHETTLIILLTGPENGAPPGFGTTLDKTTGSDAKTPNPNGSFVGKFINTVKGFVSGTPTKSPTQPDSTEEHIVSHQRYIDLATLPEKLERAQKRGQTNEHYEDYWQNFAKWWIAYIDSAQNHPMSEKPADEWDRILKPNDGDPFQRREAKAEVINEVPTKEPEWNVSLAPSWPITLEEFSPDPVFPEFWINTQTRTRAWIPHLSKTLTPKDEPALLTARWVSVNISRKWMDRAYLAASPTPGVAFPKNDTQGVANIGKYIAETNERYAFIEQIAWLNKVDTDTENAGWFYFIDRDAKYVANNNRNPGLIWHPNPSSPNASAFYPTLKDGGKTNLVFADYQYDVKMLWMSEDKDHPKTFWMLLFTWYVNAQPYQLDPTVQDWINLSCALDDSHIDTKPNLVNIFIPKPIGEEIVSRRTLMLNGYVQQSSLFDGDLHGDISTFNDLTIDKECDRFAHSAGTGMWVFFHTRLGKPGTKVNLEDYGDYLRLYGFPPICKDSPYAPNTETPNPANE